MIFRDKLRVLKNTTEITASAANVDEAVTLPFALVTTDALYIGWHEHFLCRYFIFGTKNTNACTLSLYYNDGTTWQPLTGVEDLTAGFTKNGWIAWNGVPSSWRKTNLAPLNDAVDKLYWIKIVVSANLSAGTTLRGIHNLFCDSALLKQYYPELLSDSRWLPTGQTDFVPQYIAAKNIVVERLIQAEVITQEAMVLNPDGVALAAVHASAYAILNGLSEPSKEISEWKADVLDSVDFWIEKARHSFDVNLTGEVEEQEREIGTIYLPRW